MADKKKHQDYWTKRVDEIIRYADQIDIDVFAEIARIYLEEAKLVQKELFAFYQRFADDNGLTLQEAMYQLRHEDMSDYQQNAKRYFEQAEKDPELLKRLNEQYASARATRMDLLNLELTWRAGVLATSISSTFENHLLKTAKYAYRKAGDRRGTINEPALRELIRTPINGKNYSEHIWGNVDKLAEDLREVFRRGFIRGLNPREMAQEIAKKYNGARSRAQTIIRTDGTAIISNSVAKRYMDAGLKYYRILVHLDDRTTEICRQIAKEDKRYELSEMKAGLNAPPFHYNCRSGIVPDDEELDSDVVLEKDSLSVYSEDMKNLKESGAISSRRGDIKKQQDNFAERYYTQLKNSNREDVISKMVISSSLPRETVATALKHVLDNQYLLWDSEEYEYRVRNFYPHYDMAQSFQRLYLGNPKKSDIIMLQHESLESEYMGKYKLPYDEAHKLANQKYNYEEAD
ncbi:minor capsid protein [Streptococcus sp. 121]|uniref:minor capsid protein n=1 Tax=Streptococcus sp. 121 TaxID=2797637 RepID=UPI0018F08B98|nr:minor capsid protein [Streptococcus sp. 121]MBJ6746654.1 minor capsid protein [Streptococcus sp. 121]